MCLDSCFRVLAVILVSDFVGPTQQCPSVVCFVFKEGGCDSAKLPVALWRAVLAETLRRAAGTCFKSYSDRELNTLVDLLLHGRNNSMCTFVVVVVVVDGTFFLIFPLRILLLFFFSDGKASLDSPATQFD